jgi:hypothetical protein
LKTNLNEIENIIKQNWKYNSSNEIEDKTLTKLKTNSNKIEHKIQIELKTELEIKFKQNYWKQNSNQI